MTHYLTSRNGDFKLQVNMGCNHPDRNNEEFSCYGDCAECKHSIATMTIPEIMELLKRADCNHTQIGSKRKQEVL